MKKALSFILVLAMVFSMIPAVFAAEAEVIASGTDVAVTATDKITHTWTASSDGTLTITMGAATPGYRYNVKDAAGNTVGLQKSTKIASTQEIELVGGTEYTFTLVGFNTSTWIEAAASLTYNLTFVPAEGEDIVVSEYEVSETALALGDNTVTLLDTAVTTIYTFEPTETAVYTFTAPEGAILGYWGAGTWLLTNPNSTTNTYEWTCTGVGQTAYIGVSGVEGSFNLNVAKTGDYTVVETPIVPYENKATLETFTLPEGSKLGSYIDVTAETKHEAILGEDGYYHFNSVDGPVILVDMDYQDIILSAALQSDRPVMYAYTTDENGNKIKYDIGNAIKEYEAVMDANGYYPLTEDLILFYDVYANSAGTYTFYVTGNYNEDNVWMYCMRTVTFPEVTEPTEPEATEPEVTEPEETEPEVSEPEVTEPEASEPVSGTVVLDATVTAESGSKYTYKFAPETDGTLSVTVGNGTTNWVSDVYSFATFKTITSSSGTAEGTYVAELTAGTNYYIRVYASSGALDATPVKAVFTPVGGSTEPEVTEPEATEPEVTEPEVTEPEITEPKETEPELSEPEVTEPESSEPTSGTVVLDDTVTATSSTKYTYKFAPETDGTLTVTVGNGTTNWVSDVYSFATFKTIASSSGTAEGTYTAELTTGTNYYIRVYAPSGALDETPVKAVFTPAGGSTEPSEPEVTEPEVTEPEVTEPEVTEPEVTEPEVTEPEVTEPEVTEPEVTEPENPDVPANAVFAVSTNSETTYYEYGSEISSAIASVSGSATVTLYKDIDLSTSIITIAEGQSITLDLNGCTLTTKKSNGGVIAISGTLTVQDTSADGDGLISNTATSSDRGIVVNSTGTLNFKSGNITTKTQGVRVDSGKMTMTGGSITATQYGVYGGGTSEVTVSGGTFSVATGTFNHAVYGGGSATMVITGGYFVGGALKSSGLIGGISGGFFTTAPDAGMLATGYEVQENDDSVYLYKVVDPNAVPEDPDPTDPEVTEPEVTEPEETEPSVPETEPSEPTPSESEETEPSEPESSEPESSEPADSGVLLTVTDETVTATGYVFEYTAATAGTLNVTVGNCTPGWRYKVYFPDGAESIYRTKNSAGTSCDYESIAGNWKIVFFAFNSSMDENVAGNVSFTVTFTPAEGGGSSEVEKAEYEVVETPLVLGDNTVALLDTAVTTIFTFEPTETAVYTFTAPEGAILGYWGAGSWFLQNPNSTTNSYEWTCTGVGQTAFIGVSGIDGSFNLNVAKTGEYEVVETPIVLYENKAELTPFTVPEGATLGGYIDVTAETKHEAILGEDGYYHLNSVDGPIILVDMDYQDIILSAALQSDRPVMYAYTTDADGNKIKYDIGEAIKAYEAVMDENGYYPLTEDLILFYDTYAVGAGTYTFYVTGDYNEDNVWMYCMRTMTLPVNPVTSWNLVLDDDLKVNFNMNIADLTAEQVQITVAGEIVNFEIEGNTVSIRLAAAQMNDEITVQIIGDGNYETKTYTIRQYADTVLANPDLSQYHAIVKEMLNYGGAAQTYFNYNTENLANDGINDVAAIDIPEATTDYVVEGSADGIAYYGASLVYRDKVAIRFYFTGSAEGIEGAVQKGELFYIEVADILPQDYDKAVTVTVNGLTVSYSPMNYIVRMSQKDNANLTALLKALYNYHLAAKALREAV